MKLSIYRVFLLAGIFMLFYKKINRNYLEKLFLMKNLARYKLFSFDKFAHVIDIVQRDVFNVIQIEI